MTGGQLYNGSLVIQREPRYTTGSCLYNGEPVIQRGNMGLSKYKGGLAKYLATYETYK